MSESLQSNSLSDDFPAVLSLRDRAAVVDNITKMRLDRLLGRFMEETGFDMWIILCNEDNYDPVFLTMTPYESWCPITQILVFYHSGPGEDVQRLNISRTDMQGLHETVWDPNDPTKEKETQWECLERIVAERNPSKIAINESDVIWAADGLTVSLKKKLIETIGPKYAGRLHSAEKLATLWLETLLDEELDLFERAAAINHALIAETFSSRVITPEVTTTDDLCWHYRQRAAGLGLQKSFIPFFRIRARDPEVLKKYPIEDKVIRRGDVLHCDVGVVYLRYYTDMQEMAYVLRRGQTDVPKGFKTAMAECNELQDIFCKGLKEGLTGNQMLSNMLQEARARGLKEPMIYSHSVGYYLHEPGPLIGLPWEQEDTGPRGEVRLVANSCSTVELCVTFPIPEWDNQEVRISLEQMVAFTSQGAHILDGRQSKFHIIN
jgi:Xaa-Pro aminopeptidase